MIFHATIAADEPQRVAAVIAELWDGGATPHPANGPDCWVARAAQGIIEVRPRTGTSDDTVASIALATPLSSYQVCHIARCQEWDVRHGKRGDGFAVIELWLENRLMIEVLTPPMQRAYRHMLDSDAWRAEPLAA